MESLSELQHSLEDKKPEQLLQRKLRVRSRPPSKPTIVRGVTYYKAQSTESENDIEEQRELGMQPWWDGGCILQQSQCLIPWECGGKVCGSSRGRWDSWYLIAVQPLSCACGAA